VARAISDRQRYIRGRANMGLLSGFDGRIIPAMNKQKSHHSLRTPSPLN
jgi:hypothetical protein